MFAEHDRAVVALALSRDRRWAASGQVGRFRWAASLPGTRPPTDGPLPDRWRGVGRGGGAVATVLSLVCPLRFVPCQPLRYLFRYTLRFPFIIRYIIDFVVRHVTRYAAGTRYATLPLTFNSRARVPAAGEPAAADGAGPAERGGARVGHDDARAQHRVRQVTTGGAWTCDQPQHQHQHQQQ